MANSNISKNILNLPLKVNLFDDVFVFKLIEPSKHRNADVCFLFNLNLFNEIFSKTKLFLHSIHQYNLNRRSMDYELNALLTVIHGDKQK